MSTRLPSRRGNYVDLPGDPPQSYVALLLQDEQFVEELAAMPEHERVDAIRRVWKAAKVFGFVPDAVLADPECLALRCEESPEYAAGIVTDLARTRPDLARTAIKRAIRNPETMAWIARDNPRVWRAAMKRPREIGGRVMTFRERLLQAAAATPEAQALRRGEVTRRQMITLSTALGLSWASTETYRRWRQATAQPAAPRATQQASRPRHLSGIAGDRASGDDPDSVAATLNRVAASRPPQAGGAASFVRTADRLVREVRRRWCLPMEWRRADQVLQASADVIEGCQTGDHSARCTRVYDRHTGALVGDFIDDGWEGQRPAEAWIDRAVALAEESLPERKGGGPWH